MGIKVTPWKYKLIWVSWQRKCKINLFFPHPDRCYNIKKKNCPPTFLVSGGGCSMFSGGVVEREGWIQTTSWFQPCAPGPGLEGVIGGAQGGVQDGASGGGRAMFSEHEATSTWFEEKQQQKKTTNLSLSSWSWEEKRQTQRNPFI